MVQWINQYAHEAFGLDCPEPVPVPAIAVQKSPSQNRPLPREDRKPPDAQRTKLAIFPTSALSKKDYPLRAWLWLANRLTKDGWTVDFVCLPKEQAAMQKVCANFAVRSFPDIKALMDYLSDCTAVISNDSGGGHLASLMGKKTFTITRRKGSFSWRPGFNEFNYVLTPLIGLKLFGHYIWRPFIPIWRIPARLGEAPVKPQTGHRPSSV
jgi:ADP-heptose:LPS heptosyltransferase